MAEDVTRRDRPAHPVRDRAPDPELSPEEVIRRLYAEADAISASAIGTIDFGPPPDQAEEVVGTDVQVPADAHDQFYAKWQTAVKRLVPHPEMRRRILKEGGTFLKEGKRRHADSRMARPSVRRELNDVVAGWVADFNGLNPSELHKRLVILNGGPSGYV